MDNKIVKAGLMICDRDEYVQVQNLAGENSVPFNEKGMFGNIFTINKDGFIIELYAICCGIGKVNAASCAMLLIDKGVSVILNTGYSGGLRNVIKHDLVLGERFVEHDFDLTVLGFKPSQKPGQEYIWKSDPVIMASLLKKFPMAKPGTFVTGDCFICSNEKRDQLITDFNAIAGDMESAAIASVCGRAGVKFASLRIISDGADDGSVTSYLDTLGKGDSENLLPKLFFNWIEDTGSEIWISE